MQLRALFTSAAVLALVATPLAADAQTKARALSRSSVSKAAQQHPQVVAEFGGEVTGRTADYVRSVGGRVASQANVQGGASAFRITTLNSPVMNAFAVPGGYLYVTRQLAGLADDEAELAFILAHEAGHIAANHSKERQTRGVLTQLGALAVGLITGSSSIGQLAGQVSQGLFLSYSRSQEYEADALGVRYLAAAGYDTSAAASMLASLGEASNLEARAAGRNDERATPAWARTHPLSADRVTRVNREAAKLRRATAPLRSRDTYLSMIGGLMVDDDPAQGVVDGREFIHPDLRLRFTVPQGYGIQNGSTAVTIAGQNGQALFGSGRFDGNEQTYIAQVFRTVLGDQVRPAFTPQRRTINSIPVSYATARVQAQQGMLDVTVVAYDWGSGTAYHFVTVAPAGSGVGPFGPMIESMRRISAADAAAIRPREIDVMTVRSGDTVASLAQRMAYADLKVDRFRTLNSLAGNAVPRPGDKVKLVVFGTRR
jgi:predicted Zn-dependent protease